MLRVITELPAPKETSKKIPALLLTVLLVIVLSFVFVVVFLRQSSLSRQMSSLNWSGYSVVSNFDNPQPQFTRVNASWTVPTVNVSINNCFSAEWIGVGGQFDNTLIQTGTRQDSIDGQVTYSAWYELVPGKLVNINSLSISPGDRITASISLADADAHTWTIEIHDDTNGQSFSKSVFHISSGLSAEWIEERPSLDSNPQTLADFGQVTFTDCGAALNGKDGTISSFPSNRITMYDDQNRPLVKVSDLTQDGSSFTVSFLG
jgi:Peptidase A4 family